MCNSCGNCGGSCHHHKNNKSVWSLMSESAIGGFILGLAYIFTFYCKSLNSGISLMFGYTIFALAIYFIFNTGAKIPTICVIYNMRNKGKDMFSGYREKFRGYNFAGNYGKTFILLTMSIEVIIFFILGTLFACVGLKHNPSLVTGFSDVINELNASGKEAFINGVFRGFLGTVCLLMSHRVFVLSKTKTLCILPIILMIALGGLITPMIITAEMYNIVLEGGTFVLMPILRTLVGSLIACLIWSSLVQD